MSEKRARLIRRAARLVTPATASPEPEYAVEVRTVRKRVGVGVIGTQADGSPQMGKVEVTTATFRLAKTCAKFHYRLVKRLRRNFFLKRRTA